MDADGIMLSGMSHGQMEDFGVVSLRCGVSFLSLTHRNREQKRSFQGGKDCEEGGG